MTTKLTIDEGNSSTKVALWEDDRMTDVRTCPVDEIPALMAGRTVDAAIFCSVCRRDPELRRMADDLLAPLAVRYIRLGADTPVPLTVDYRTPATLGADRLAAACGAAALAPGRTVLTVDMGTAITYDVVTADAHFAGGNIAPGIFVRLEALNHFTSALPLVETDGDCPRWGYDTATAMRAGAIRGVVGEIQYYRHCLGPDAVTILTGGSADLVLPYISSPAIVEPNLVLTGLNRILNYNENQ